MIARKPPSSPHLFVSLLLVAATAPAAWGGGLRCATEALLDAAPTATEDQIAGLRQAGPAALDSLLASLERRGRSLDQLGPAETELLDRTCGMRDCAAARLFWFTDLERAREAAQRLGRPILSLRLLGRLDEEASCANSRFFRTVLYPDPAIGRLLRDELVLHWRSVRAVPRVTIEFGDGRTLSAPVTGNSIHYLLDSRGRLVDAIPGLYAPRIFHDLLREGAAAAREAAALDDEEFVRWAGDRSRRIAARLDQDLTDDYERLQERRRREAREGGTREAPRTEPARPELLLATAPLTLTKVRFENPLVAAFRSPSAAPGPWHDLKPLYLPASRLSEPSRRLALAKHGIDDPERARALLATLEDDIARDTILNQYRFRRVLHSWLARAPRVDGLEELNDRVYTELFEMPPDDPWMGLSPAGVYAALPAGGRGGER